MICRISVPKVSKPGKSGWMQGGLYLVTCMIRRRKWRGRFGAASIFYKQLMRGEKFSLEIRTFETITHVALQSQNPLSSARSFALMDVTSLINQNSYRHGEIIFALLVGPGSVIPPLRRPCKKRWSNIPVSHTTVKICFWYGIWGRGSGVCR